MRLFYMDFHNVSGHDAAYGLLGYAFTQIFGDPLPEISKAENGKPYFPSRPDVHFSLSHTKGYVLCAIGNSPVGADMEKIREIRPNLEKRVRSDAERESFDFFSSWVLKESFIKLCGTMTMPLRKMMFTGTADEIICPQEGIFAKLYDTAEGYRTAICSCDKNLPKAAEFVSFDTIFDSKTENS